MPDRVTAFAPGRVNLIGEHTDYNQGLALPFAIGQGVTVTATRGDAPRVTAVAADLGAHDTFGLPSPPRAPGSRAFDLGITSELSAPGYELVGARQEVSGAVPPGTGLAS